MNLNRTSPLRIRIRTKKRGARSLNSGVVWRAKEGQEGKYRRIYPWMLVIVAPLHLLGVFGQGNTTNHHRQQNFFRQTRQSKKWLDSAAADPAGSFLARWVIPIFFAYFSAKYSKTGKTLLGWRARKTHQNSLLRFEFRRDFECDYADEKINMDQ